MAGSSRRHAQHHVKIQPKDQATEVRLVFSEDANKQFLKFGVGVRDGLLRKLKEFALNPAIGKPLTGDLKGFYRVSYGRVRAVVRSDGQNPVALIIVTQVRKEGSPDDPYSMATEALRKGRAGIDELFAAHLRAYLTEHQAE